MSYRTRSDPPVAAEEDALPTFKSQSYDRNSLIQAAPAPIQGRLVGSSSANSASSSSQFGPPPHSSQVSSGVGRASALRRSLDESPLKNEDSDSGLLCVNAKLMPDAVQQQNEISAASASSSTLPVRSREDLQESELESEVEPNSEDPKEGNSILRKYRYWIIGGVAFVVILGVALGLALGLSGGSGEEPSPPPVDHEQVGSTIEGNRHDHLLGSALAISKTGRRIAVASPGAVTVYELITSNWEQLGEEIVVSNSNEHTELREDGFVQVAMNSGGERIVIGFGNANNKTGVVQVYQYESGAWDPVGEAITGVQTGDLFGSAVSMNSDGDTIAVGAPGYDGNTGKVVVYQMDKNRIYQQLGKIIQGDDRSTLSEFGGSVSLSQAGQRVAAAARSRPDGLSQVNSPVVKVFQYNRFQNEAWTALGEGVSPGTTSKSTGWHVSLSARGDRMVASNSYLDEVDFVNLEPNSLVVQAFYFQSEKWKPLGQNMHANEPGAKSGYLAVISDDGTKIGMGDPGTSSGGRGRGHAHIYEFDENKKDWLQNGQNIDGQADGDNFGFSVALSGDGNFFAAGAPFNRAASSNAGHVRVFSV